MNVELSPAGAAREREVPCASCGRPTWNHSGSCRDCLSDDDALDIAEARADVEDARRSEVR